MNSIYSRKNYFAVLVFLAALGFANGISNGETYGGGSGTPNDPYLIYDANQMNAIGANSIDWNNHFKLMADIDLSDFNGLNGNPPFNIIGTASNPFTGSFEGSNYIISNLSSTSTGVGLLNYIDNTNTEIKNLGLVNPNISMVGNLVTGTIKDCYTEGGTISGGGALVRYNDKGEILNCYSSSKVTKGSWSIGGLVGTNKNGLILNCYSTGRVKGSQTIPASGLVGGLVGYNMGHGAKILNCYSSSRVYASGNEYKGGLIGCNSGTIQDCNATGNLEGGGCGGGLVGYNTRIIVNSYATGNMNGGKGGGLVGFNSKGSISESYATGMVSGGDYLGGLVGENDEGDIYNCYAIGDVHGGTWGTYLGGLVGWNERGIISNCYAIGSTRGGNRLGGLVGKNQYGEIYCCYATGSVQGGVIDRRGHPYAGYGLGGLVGSNFKGKVIDSYCTGAATGHSEVGGLIGGNSGAILNCYSIGRVQGRIDKFGGLVGDGSSGFTFSSYWNIQTSGQTNSAGGSGKTTAEMKMASTYDDWGLEPIWTIDEGVDYPHLVWENMPGEVITTQPYAPGSGTMDEPYRIYTSEQMNAIGLFPHEWGKYFKLMADINLGAFTGTEFNIIGHPQYPFTGVFDGGGHTISNFNYNTTKGGNLGLFVCVDDHNAIIKELGLIEVHIDNESGSSIGALVGKLVRGTVKDCYVDGGSILGYNYLGGLVGNSMNGTISNCYSTCNVIGVDDWIGGLVGYMYLGDINSCYATGSVSGNKRVGGLVGWGRVVRACFWDTETSGQERGGSGAVGKTTSEMKMKSTFTDAGWDFTTPIWIIDEGNDYPRLWWEGNAGPVACIVGGDRVVETDANCEVRIVLDGSCSSDEDSTQGTNDDINDFDWYEVIDPCDANSDILLGSGEIIEGNLPLGGHDIMLEVTDKAGAYDTNEVTIQVENVTPPVISLNGSAIVILECGVDSYTEEGATAADNCDEDVEVVIGGDTVDTSTCRTYSVTYDATDDSGNAVEQVTRTIIVEDTLPPVIVLNGPNLVVLECGVDSYVEEGAMATDNCDEEVPVMVGGDTVDTSVCGTYIVTYEAIDDSGNVAQASRIVEAIDTLPPEFSLSVEPNVLWPVNHKMVEITPNWVLSDNCDDWPDVSLVSITTNEDADGIGGGHTTDDIWVDANDGIHLRAERSGKGTGRVYTITYQAVDDSNNVTVDSAIVTVPHDMR